MSTPQARGAFGQLLRHHRAAAGLSQEELAERAGLSRRAISDLERGVHRTPYPATARRLARALGLESTAQAALLAAGQHVAAVVVRPIGTGRHTGLPRPLSSFIGRERELAELREWLLDHRLVTLTGPGGVGKTRLALEFAREGENEIVFVDLASLQRAAIVAETVATALGIIATTGEDLLASMARALAGRNVLVVLDNCEHVVGACAELAQRLLPECPTLQILATSRERFGIAGEAVWTVAPLAVSNPAERLSPEALAEVPSVRLFIERAQLSGLPDFGVTPSNASRVAEICYRLEGIPLALELAAARVHILGVVQLAGRLDESLTLLSSGTRSGSARHPTLRATLDWSYQLLSETERTLFARLAVFAGGWTLEAAEMVGAWDELAREDVLGVLAQLVDRSLVATEPTPDGGARYRLLETVRQYAHERLAEWGDLDAVRQRHGVYYRDLAERADPELFGPDQVAWVARLEAELGNLRAALDWCATGSGDPELGLRIAAALWWFWPRSGHLEEGRAYLPRMLALNTQPTSIRAWGLLAHAMVAWHAGDVAATRAALQAGLALEECADERTILWTHMGLAHLALVDGDATRAETTLRRGLARGEHVADGPERYVLLWMLGELKRAQGDLIAAERLLEEALEQIRAHGDHDGIGTVLASLGHVAFKRGDLARAVFLQTESLAIRQAVSPLRSADCLDNMAIVATKLGELERATRLFAAAVTQRARTGAAVWALTLADREHALVEARAGLGDAAFEAAWQVGSGLSPAQAISESGALGAAAGTMRREGEGEGEGGLSRGPSRAGRPPQQRGRRSGPPTV